MFINKRNKPYYIIIIILIVLIALPVFSGYAGMQDSNTEKTKETTPPLIIEMLTWSISNAENIFSTILGQFYPGRDEIVLGTPNLSNLISGRLQIITNPEYWRNYLNEALVKGIYIIPVPFDPVKPELFLPTSPVEAGINTSPLPLDYVNLDGVTYEWYGKNKTIKEYMVTSETDCIVFIHNGKIVYEDYANGWIPGMVHQPWSATKAITSTMVGIAWDEGKIESVHDPIEKYISDLKGTDWEGSTIENLLQMESGMYWNEEIPLLAFNSQVQQWMSVLLDFLSNGFMGTTRNEYFKTMKRVSEPSEEFMYNSGGTQVLAWLVETLYETTFADAVSQKIWKPAGMEGDAHILTDRVGAAIASQSFFALPYDLARFGELFRNNGKSYYGRQIVSPKWIEMSTNFTDNSQGNYGYQWWNGSTDLFIYDASGFQGNKISVCPEANFTAVRMSHNLGADLRPNGDNPAKFSTYGFDIVMGQEEWHTMITAVAKELGFQIISEDQKEEEPE